MNYILLPGYSENEKVIILCYHDLLETPINPWTLNPKDFYAHLYTLQRLKYRVVTLDNYYSYKDDPNIVVITFDDAREGAFKHSPRILDYFNYKATFYVPVNLIYDNNLNPQENYTPFMSWKQIIKLSRMGHSIGSHSLTHRNLLNLSYAERTTELVESKRIIETFTKKPCVHFSAPYGGINLIGYDQVRSAGYETLVTMNPSRNIYPYNRHNLNRVEITSDCNQKNFEQLLKDLAK
jgi:peptidoglycan/xylan/chitin deacetylase (PgdA/CDA1 family)